ncbi:hypothetical protein SNEBB_004670, partial [Seison nebaliae]
HRIFLSASDKGYSPTVACEITRAYKNIQDLEWRWLAVYMHCMQGLRSHKQDLMILIKDYAPIIIGIQETLLPTRPTFHIPQYTAIQNNGPQPAVMGNGVALLIKNNIPFTKIDIATQLQAIAARVHTTSLITYCTIYLSPQGNVPVAELEQLIQTLPPPFLIFGDMNARHASWNDHGSFN